MRPRRQVRLLTHFARRMYLIIPLSGNNSMVECHLPKVKVAGSNPVSRSKPGERQLRLFARFILLLKKKPRGAPRGYRRVLARFRSLMIDRFQLPPFLPRPL